MAARAPHPGGVPGLDDLDLVRGEGHGANDGGAVAVRPALAFEDAVGGEPGGVVGAARERPASPGEVAAIDGFGRPAGLPGAGDEGLARTEDLRGSRVQGRRRRARHRSRWSRPSQRSRRGGRRPRTPPGRAAEAARARRFDDALDNGHGRARLALRLPRLGGDERGHGVESVEVGVGGSVHGGQRTGIRSKAPGFPLRTPILEVHRADGQSRRGST